LLNPADRDGDGRLIEGHARVDLARFLVSQSIQDDERHATDFTALTGRLVYSSLVDADPRLAADSLRAIYRINNGVAKEVHQLALLHPRPAIVQESLRVESLFDDRPRAVDSLTALALKYPDAGVKRLSFELLNEYDPGQARALAAQMRPRKELPEPLLGILDTIIERVSTDVVPQHPTVPDTLGSWRQNTMAELIFGEAHVSRRATLERFVASIRLTGSSSVF